jgi:uncharacterized membrane protein
MMAVMVPLYILFFVGFIALAVGQGGQPDEESVMRMFALMGGVYLLLLLLSLLIQVFFLFTYPLIVDRGLKAVPALKTSFRACWANFPGVLGLVLLNGLIGLLGALCCYVPLVFALPICFGATVLAYRKVFPAQTPIAARETDSAPGPVADDYRE